MKGLKYDKMMEGIIGDWSYNSYKNSWTVKYQQNGIIGSFRSDYTYGAGTPVDVYGPINQEKTISMDILNGLVILGGEPTSIKHSVTGLGWDLNNDGKFQKNEADNWWLNGGGKTVNVNNANIDWAGLKIPTGKVKGDNFLIKTTEAFLKLPYETAATYGGTSFKVVSTIHVQVIDQLYHYNMRDNNSFENKVRNYLTKQGKPNGKGTDFLIHYYNSIIRIK